MEPIKGKAWVFGDHINADAAIEYSATLGQITDPGELKKRCMIGYNTEFQEKMKPGDIIVAGKNFACGNLHPQFNLALKGARVGAIVAESFSRGFFRAGIYEGILSIESKGILQKVKQGDELRIDLGNGTIRNLRSGGEISILPLPEPLLTMIESGGLVPFLRKVYRESKSPCS